MKRETFSERDGRRDVVCCAQSKPFVASFRISARNYISANSAHARVRDGGIQHSIVLSQLPLL